MSIKKAFRTGILLLLALCMLLSFAACKDEEAPVDTGEQETADPSVQLAFPKTNYKAEFKVLYPEWQMYKDYFFAEEEQRGETIADAILDRADMVYDYLGVDVQGVPTPTHGTDAISSIAVEAKNKVSAGDDAYQLILTHTFSSVSAMVTDGYLLDFYGMENINLEGDYWNKGAVDSLAVGGAGYYALSDYLIADPVSVFFNKGMLADYTQLPDPYQLVRDKQWTLEKMFQMASQVDVDNDGFTNPLDGTYGFTSMADWTFISLIDSCDVEIIRDDEGYKVLDMSAGNEAYAGLLDTVFENVGSDWTYLWKYDAPVSEQMNISLGRALFSMESLKDAYKHRESEVKFGILPTPTGSEGQDYRSFNWSGMMCVPNTVKNQTMVEQTLEALAYFSTSTLKVAYYEKLLGGRLAEAPDDKAMLDVIWDSIVLNPAINYLDKPDSELGYLIYSIARGVEGIRANGKPGFEIASRWNSYVDGAQDIINTFLNA